MLFETKEYLTATVITAIQLNCSSGERVPGFQGPSSTSPPRNSYCWFSVSRNIKIKIKTVQKIRSRIWKKKEGKYAKTLTKNQITAIFLKRVMRRNVLLRFIEICMETPCWCPSIWAPTWRPEINKNICH